MSPLLSPQTLVTLRGVASAALPDSAAVERPTEVIDAVGGVTKTWATVATYACRLSRGQTPDERVVGESVAPRQTETLYLPWDANLGASDRVTVSYADGARASAGYDVVGVIPPTSYLVHVRAVVARRD